MLFSLEYKSQTYPIILLYTNIKEILQLVSKLK